MALFNRSFVKIELKMARKPPSLTPIAPGDGMPDTVAYNTDCSVIISKALCPCSPKEQYTQ